jgi:hypothetical protein
MNFDTNHPYYSRLWWRTKLPWFLIEKGWASKGINCKLVKAKHHWYKIDDIYSGCYYCKIIVKGKKW